MVGGKTVYCHAVVEMRFQENAFVVYTRDGGPCWIVDPGFAPQHKRIGAFVAEHELEPVAIMITHGHSDHIAGIDHVAELYPEIALYVGPKGKTKLYDANENLSAPFGFPIVVRREVTGILNIGDRVELDGASWEVLDTAGHCSSGQSFYCAEAGVVLAGDALFSGSIGRTDFPDSDHDQLIRNIRENLLTLPGATVVYAGHGPATSIETERKSNPFLCG